MARARVSNAPDGLERQAARREEAQLVHEEVAKLPEACRTAVVLCDLEGQSHEEAARRLRCSDRTRPPPLGSCPGPAPARLVRRGLAPTARRPAHCGPWARSGPRPRSRKSRWTHGPGRDPLRGRPGDGRTVLAAATTLAEGVITAMFWIKLKTIAIASSLFLAIGIGAGVTLGFVTPADDKKVESNSGAKAILKGKSRPPREQYRALVKEFDDAMAAYNNLREKAKTQAERQAIDKIASPRSSSSTRDSSPWPSATRTTPPPRRLVWIIEKTMRYTDGYHRLMAETIDRSMEILARDHLGDARLGPLCLKLVLYPSSRRDDFLRAVAERSPDRVCARAGDPGAGPVSQDER